MTARTVHKPLSVAVGDPEILTSYPYAVNNATLEEVPSKGGQVNRPGDISVMGQFSRETCCT
ncbi:MAG: hypothetical protein V1792_25655 [Pseudomonadota bacterium]